MIPICIDFITNGYKKYKKIGLHNHDIAKNNSYFDFLLVETLAWATNFLHYSDSVLQLTVLPGPCSAGRAVAGESPPAHRTVWFAENMVPESMKSPR